MEADLLHLMDDPEGPTLHAIALFVALLCACIVVGHHLEKNRWLNESIIALGIVPGEEKAVFPKLHHDHAVWCYWFFYLLWHHFYRFSVIIREMDCWFESEGLSCTWSNPFGHRFCLHLAGA
ncbi:hypothetical protein Dsin_025287 [Dipteronia sinensis]|uniref:Uncharacterized protein n=1 Tax=Dipteronia sinensis TaxID=43782 RepID=A0AAD9ZW10_9ROSI|nr:hypothetical protein Dsin_025287 [Dipteronia sinensis]